MSERERANVSVAGTARGSTFWLMAAPAAVSERKRASVSVAGTARGSSLFSRLRRQEQP
jgi:hypothetical protein